MHVVLFVDLITRLHNGHTRITITRLRKVDSLRKHKFEKCSYNSSKYSKIIQNLKGV